MAGVSKNNIRERLVEAGLKELLLHGYEDFSLRRVAASLEVSCASPYRYFKDKSELVSAVVLKMRENWLLLAKSISEVCPSDEPSYIAELIVGGMRFWVGGNLYAQLLSIGKVSLFDEPIISAVEAQGLAHGLSIEDCRGVATLLLGLMYGEITLVLLGRSSAKESADRLRRSAKEALDKAFK